MLLAEVADCLDDIEPGERGIAADGSWVRRGQAHMMVTAWNSVTSTPCRLRDLERASAPRLKPASSFGDLFSAISSNPDIGGKTGSVDDLVDQIESRHLQSGLE